MSSQTTAPANSRAAFLDGLKAASRSAFVVVIAGSYVSIGALAHGLGFSLPWVLLSTVLIWAAPAQVILISSLGAGAPPLEAGLAVGLSAVRLLPMVVALLPVLKSRRTRVADMILPAHFTAVSVWIETLRLAPGRPREHRIAFANGIGTGLVVTAIVSNVAGFYLAEVLPDTIVAAMLFLTPMSFLTSALRNARLLSDQAAFVIGVVMGPLLAYEQVGLDLLWTGLLGGSAAYAIHRLREFVR
jgi:predicted branched-subunit amino acid permease